MRKKNAPGVGVEQGGFRKRMGADVSKEPGAHQKIPISAPHPQGDGPRDPLQGFQGSMQPRIGVDQGDVVAYPGVEDIAGKDEVIRLPGGLVEKVMEGSRGGRRVLTEMNVRGDEYSPLQGQFIQRRRLSR